MSKTKFLFYSNIKDTLKSFNDFKNKRKRVWSNAFSNSNGIRTQEHSTNQRYVYSESVFNTIYI